MQLSDQVQIVVESPYSTYSTHFSSFIINFLHFIIIYLNFISIQTTVFSFSQPTKSFLCFSQISKTSFISCSASLLVSVYLSEGKLVPILLRWWCHHISHWFVSITLNLSLHSFMPSCLSVGAAAHGFVPLCSQLSVALCLCTVHSKFRSRLVPLARCRLSRLLRLQCLQSLRCRARRQTPRYPLAKLSRRILPRPNR